MKLAKSLLLPSILWAVALAAAQPVTTTSVQGTVYSASGAPISGTLQLSWPSFTAASSQAIAAGRLTVTIGADGFLSVNLAPNQGARPAGLYYTAIYHLEDGTTSTEYWVVPAAAQATLAQVRAQVMPAAQAVQAVNKAYVDQAILQSAQSQISSFGGTLNGPLYLNGDPAVPTQAADKHYVDNLIGQTVPISGGVLTGPVTATQLGAVHQADQSAGTDFGSRLQSCINALNTTYGGTCDARNFSGALTISAPIAIATANITVQLPCATIATANPIVIAAGMRNVTLHGCATRGSSSASGSQGGTVFLYSGSAAFFQVGDPTYSADTLGFHLDNVVVNTTAATASSAQALAAWRTQELHLESLYLLGNSNQTALTLDGTGNYTGGTFQDIEIGGFLTAVNAIGHQVSNSATTDWLNASTFLRLHIDCPTSSGNPIAGTVGINLQQGDGNTFTGGDVEGCGTALHLGANAQNNTIVGLRNENSTSQVVADAGSAYNNWIAGGTMFSGKLTDNGTRNSFLDTFHRSFNALNGDWYGSQQDATVTNHFRIGIGSGNERGLLNRYQTDYGYRWTTGISDAAAGEQFYQVLDELNNVFRLSIGQYNNGQPSTNNQTVVNSAGTGAIVLNGSNNAGTGGVLIGSGGATSSTVATIDKSGNAQFTGTLQVGGAAQSTGTLTVRNNADAEVDYYLWPGLTASQKGSFTYKDYNGNSQWYMVKDAGNNWALNSATSGLDSFKAYQSTNSGDTYVNASNSGGVVRVNYEPGSGSAFNIYGGNSGTLYAGFTGPTSIKLPGLAAASGHNCMQVDNSGYLSNSGQPCGAGTVGAGILGQIAYYTATGAALSGVNAVPLASGGTGASDAPTALANLGAVPASGGVMTGPLNGTSATFASTVAAGTALPAGAPVGTVAANVVYTPNGKQNALAFGAVGDGSTNDYNHILAAIAAAQSTGNCAYFPAKVYAFNTPIVLSPTGNRSGAPFCIEFETGAWFKYTGASTADAFYLNASGAQNGQIFDLHNVAVDGNGLAANGIHTNTAVGSMFDRLRVKNVTGDGILVQNSYDNIFIRPTVSTSADLMTTIPANGIVFQGSTATPVIMPKTEGLTGIGVYILQGSTISVSGGTSEGNAIGVEVDAPSTKNSIEKIDLEGNTAADIKISAQQTTVSVINGGSAGGLLITGNGANTIVSGSSFPTCTLASSSAQQNFFIQSFCSTFTDSGTNTGYIQSVLNGSLQTKIPAFLPTNATTATQLVAAGWEVYQSGSSLIFRDTVNGTNFISLSPGANGTVNVQAGHPVAPAGGVDMSNGAAGSGAFLRMLDQGSCTMTSGACASVTLNHTYATAPVCLGNWTGAGTLTGILKMPTTTTSVTPASSVGTDTAVISYVCFGK